MPSPAVNNQDLSLFRRVSRKSRIGILLNRFVRRPAIGEFDSGSNIPGLVDRYTGPFGSLFDAHSGRLCQKWHHYFEMYDRYLLPMKARRVDNALDSAPLRFLEIGVSHGGSLELWRQYFGPDAIIHGVDIDLRCADLGSDDLPVHVGSQTDRQFMEGVVALMGGLDAVLDDGSHLAKHQRETFDILFPLLEDGGIYMIEDVHTSYWVKWGGGFRRPGSIVQVAKSMVDGMHKWYFRFPVGKRSLIAKTDVKSITFADSVIVFEKGKHGRPTQESKGVESWSEHF